MPRVIAELEIGQLIFVAALLLGFAMSIASQLILSNPPAKAKTITFFIFLVSALLLMVGLYTDIRLLIELAGQEHHSKETLSSIVSIRKTGTICTGLGFLVFFAGMGSLGWIRSKRMGMATTAIALLAFLLVNNISQQIRALY